MIGSSSADNALIFDRRSVRLHRERALFRFSEYDFLFREIASRLVDRLCDFNRTFPCTIDLGSHGGLLKDALPNDGKIERLIQTNMSGKLLRPDGEAVVADDEFLPFASSSADLVISNLSLHWVNDLPGTLVQIRRILRPDGLFLAAMLGGETLRELRHALIEAETRLSGGAAPRISPFADLSDAAALLQRAGFSLPVADMDTVTVTYPDAFALMQELRGMGETNALAERTSGFTPRGVFMDAAARYADLYADADGRLPATFQILYLAGWAPHESQQQPARPGSAQSRLADALETNEQSAGESTGRKPTK